MDAIPHQLPLLTFLENSYDIERKLPFNGYACVFIQHLLGSNIPLINSIEKGGVKKEDIYIIGKAYSSNISVLNYFEKNNYNYINSYEGYSIDICYDNILKNEIRKVFISLLFNSNLPILLLDDAAKGICIAHEDIFKQYLYRFKCVELTSRGISEINKIILKCPVINVATSDAKKRIEAPLIGKSMVFELMELLNSWKKYYRPPNNNVLIIGYGAIGKSVCKELLNYGFNILVYDIDSEQINSAKRSKYVTTNDFSVESLSGIVIGCTGTASISYDKFNSFQDGTLFVNMASSDLEFGLWKFEGNKSVFLFHKTKKNKQTLLSNENKIKTEPWKCLYKIMNHNKTFYLANGGFPVNFTGEIDPIPPEEIQITRSLVLAGALQAVNEKENGLIGLNENIQTKLINLYNKKSTINK